MTESEEKLLPPTEDRKLLDRPAEERLREQLDARGRKNHRQPDDDVPRPSTRKLALIGLAVLAVLVALFFMGLLPRLHRNHRIETQADEEEHALPVVNVVKVKQSDAASELLLPGNITSLTESPIFARADGYIRKRYVDIGDHVRQGQLLAEIDAPELEQQVRQGEAGVRQARAALGQVQASLGQNEANLRLAAVTLSRWKTLVEKGVVSRQEADQQQANYDVQQANLTAAQANIRAAQDNVASAEANLARLRNLQGYSRVVAPFTGIITARNVDVGALVSQGGSQGAEMFRIAQSDVLRIMVNVPQGSSPFVHVGEAAQVQVQEYASRKFIGHVSRTSNALDPSSRTLLTEVQVPNRDGALLPGMYATVLLIGVRSTPAIVIPGDALVVRADGAQVATLDPGNRVHYQKIEVGRDYGTEIEVRSGLEANQTVVVNPSDDVREGAVVQPEVVKPQRSAPGAGGGLTPNKAGSGSGGQQPRPGLGGPPTSAPIKNAPGYTNAAGPAAGSAGVGKHNDLSTGSK